MAARRHPKKEVQDALDQVLSDPWWRLEMGGHWGFLLCGHRERDGCRIAINATPQSAGAHAVRIVRESLKCPHRGSAETT
jgi:hypothetical protein